ncbi:di-trans,poly-cis-decaprenylcistransferase [Syntrophotalea acetylenivorans]|uniref:Isoprenyl transferase n=1 Tax=Syntrophotalea acetylenivorans TaxID=1842532 RepID=A0A1L3GT14_9BACT|nr:isoprenyl transferase [Syntrophotalea acetylenivorans]APG29025.1 di-trans,poly-cis-decaprenylcistransferase [Syntrophotalea acetylenivorans]
MRIPQHLAIIMDGNGRWAEQRQMPRIFGHRQGVETVRSVVKECRALGVPHLTLYAFSSENWGRPASEVAALMELLGLFLAQELETLMAEDIRLRVIGNTSLLPVEVRQVLDDTIKRTAENSRLVLTLALSYGARDEILRAVKGLATEVEGGELAISDIDEQRFSAALDTAGLPDPDLLIRTSGEMRISNFLLWQLAYAELYFTDVLWPDFSADELRRAFDDFAARQRRFGLTAAQSVSDS